MRPRGPDGGGTVVRQGRAGAVALGSRRLAIMDITAAGDQPMSAHGVDLAFNGMIYNFRRVRAALEQRGHRFRSGSDTEVVLRSYLEYGQDFLRRLHGMFGLALWDGRSGELLLGRDRLGIKPLYYADSGGQLVAASQVKALVRSGAVGADLSPEGVLSFLETGAVRDPLTAVKGVRALPAGHLAIWDGASLACHRYWQPPEEVDAPEKHADAPAELRARLEEAVRTHLAADAPLGVFLSGGLDSSMLTALARRTTDVLTVSVVFDDQTLSEKPLIDANVAHLGVRNEQVQLTGDEVLRSLPDVFAAMDQPTFDGLNTFVVSRAAARLGLKVAVSGLGGDELFDGYGFLRRVRAMVRLAGMPAPVRHLAAAATPGGPSRRAKMRAWAQEPDGPAAAHRLLRRLFLPDAVARLLPDVPYHQASLTIPAADVGQLLALADLQGYTRDVLLRDTDAMSMAHSLEVRVPFLDDALVEWGLRLPMAVRGQGKSLQIAAAQPLLPAETLAAPKRGFALPLSSWMRSELAQHVEDVLGDPPAALAAHLDPGRAMDVWHSFRRGHSQWHQPWAIFALAQWAASLEASRPAVRQ